MIQQESGQEISTYARAINAHYSPGNLEEAIPRALRATGKGPDAVTLDDLAPLDQLHIRGMEATLELAQMAALGPGMTVLDMGGGLGGAARVLARQFGCTVTVLDLTEELCRVGETLTRWTGLSRHVSFVQGDAMAPPFDSQSFDVVWTQHLSMNVADKRGLYAGIRRMLRPGGLLAFHEILGGAVAPLRFPVPWAGDSSISFLRRREWTRNILPTVGLYEVLWGDATALSLAHFKALWSGSAMNPLPPPILGPHLLFGQDTDRMLRNQVQNLAEDRLAVAYGVFRS